MNYQRNLILSAAVSAAFGITSMSAHAGVGSALPATISTAALVNNTTAVTGNQVVYSTVVPLANATTYYIYVQLATGVFSTAVAQANLILPTGITFTSVANSTDGTFAVYTVATTAAVPVNSLITFIPTAAGAISNLTSLDTPAGGNVVINISIGSRSQVTTSLHDIDSAAGGPVITFTPPEAFFACSSGLGKACSSALGAPFGGNLGVEAAKIDVQGGAGTSITGSVWATPANTVEFGGFMVTDNPGVLAADNATAWDIATEYNAAGGITATLSGNFAAATPAGSIFLDTADTTCSTSAIALNLNAASNAASGSGTPVASGNAYGVCVTYDGTTVIQPTSPTIGITMVQVAGFAGTALPFGPSTLYNLTQNGGSVTIRAYLPAASGYSDVVRIINVGSNVATVAVARIDPATGLTGPSGTLPGTVAVGAAVNYLPSVIETALGGPLAAGDRPRLIFTANTNIEGQNYILNPDMTVTTLHGNETAPGSN
jgi:hypothetical protein